MTLIAGLCGVVVGVGAAPGALGKAKVLKCRNGTIRVKVGAKAACVSRKLVLPAPSNAHPIVAGVEAALVFTQLSFKARSGKHVESFVQQFGRSWLTARARQLKALSAMIARVQQTASRPMARSAAAGSQACATADLLSDYGTDAGGNTVNASNSASIGGATVTMGLDSSGMHFGVSVKAKGDTYTMKYDSGELSCLAYKLPPCPEADGTLNAYGVKGKTGFSETVTRGGKVLKKESYAKTITVETQGQVADDAKLDYVDVKYGETTNIVRDGIRLTQYGNRTVRINMRTGGYDPGESFSFGSASAFGGFANVAGQEADAKDFAAFVSQTIKAYKDREAAWQTPNQCAKLTFDPVSNTLTVRDGDKGSFSAQVTANSDGQRAARARWTLSAQQNGTFSPTTASGSEPSFDYTVAVQSGTMLSTTVRATSTAGVAQENWRQNIKQINTITGSFTGHENDNGMILDWSGTATFLRQTSIPTPGGGVFPLASGHATVTVSGTQGGCAISGSGQIDLAPQGVFTLMPGNAYQIVAPFVGTQQIPATEQCSSGPISTAVAPAGAAIQTGDPVTNGPTALIQHSPDGQTFSGSASAAPSPGESSNWTWSFTGSP